MKMKSLLAAAALLASSAPLQAVPLNLTLPAEPDFFSDFIDVSYSSGTDVFVANGFAAELMTGGGTEAVAGGTFNLTAAISDAGLLSPGGSLSIGGTIAALGFNSGTLLTGTLTALGFAAGGDPLEFLFDVTGGDAATLFGGIGATGGIVFGATGFGGDWTQDFGSLFASSDTGVVVAEPGILLLLSLGLLAIVAWRRQARSNL